MCWQLRHIFIYIKADLNVFNGVVFKLTSRLWTCKGSLLRQQLPYRVSNSPWWESHAKCGKRKWPYGHQYTPVVEEDTELPHMHDPEYLVHNGRKADLILCILVTVFLVSSPSLNTLISWQIYLLSLSPFFVVTPREYKCWGALFSACLVMKPRTREIISQRSCCVFLLLMVYWFMMPITNVASQTPPQKRTLQVHVTNCPKALSTSALV